MDTNSQAADTNETVISRVPNRPWSLAYLTADETVRLEFATDLLGAPTGLPDEDLVTPETGLIENDTLSILLYSERTENWYQLVQRESDCWATEVRCAVDLGRGWAHLALERPPIEPANAAGVPGTVADLPGFTIEDGDSFEPDRFETRLR
jgi:hypothetical protein